MTLKTLVRVANALEMKVDTKFVPREKAAKPAKKPQAKTAIGPELRRSAKPRPGRTAAVASRTKR